MRRLTKQEIESVSGGVGPIIGGLAGGAAYTASNFMTGRQFSLADFSAAVTFGAVTSGLSALGGALTGAASIARFAHASAIGALSSSAVYGSVSTIGGGGGATMRTGSHILVKHN